MFFWNCLAFSMIHWMLAIWSLVPLPFLNPVHTSASSQFTYCWSLAWRILSKTLLACEISTIVQQSEHFFVIAFLWDWSENWPFPVLWPLLSFPNLLAYFRIWNSSAGILSPLLALFIVRLPKYHLTSHSRMSGSSEWSHHRDYLSREGLFCVILLCILATPS